MEGSVALLFMGSDGSGPYLVEGPPGNGPLPVLATLSPLALQNVNLTEVLNNPTVLAGLPGLLAIGGPSAAGAALDLSNPLKVAGSDGADLRVLFTDSSGRLEMVGTAAGGAPIDASNPLKVAGSDGAAVRVLQTDAQGRLAMVGTAPAGAALDASNPLKVAGSDGVDLRVLFTDALGRLEMVGTAAAGAVLDASNPLKVAGSDGANLRILFTDATGRLQMVGTEAAGAALDASNPVKVAGSDGANLRVLLTDATGAVFERPAKAATYAASYLGSTTGQGVLFQLKGSASKVVRVTRAVVAGFLPASASAQLFQFRRDTAAATAGTPVAQTAVPNDSANPAATAVATAFSTAATENGVLGPSYTYITFWQVVSAGPTEIIDVVFGGLNSRAQEMVLRNANEYFSVVIGNSLAASTSIAVSIEWTEE